MELEHLHLGYIKKVISKDVIENYLYNAGRSPMNPWMVKDLFTEYHLVSGKLDYPLVLVSYHGGSVKLYSPRTEQYWVIHRYCSKPEYYSLTGFKHGEVTYEFQNYIPRYSHCEWFDAIVNLGLEIIAKENIQCKSI